MPLNTSDQYDALYKLWEVYLHMSVWGLPEYEQLDADARAHFAELVQTGTLFNYVEDCKRDVMRAGLNPPNLWLWLLCASRCAEGPLPQDDRDTLGTILSQIYLRLAKLDADSQAGNDPCGKRRGRPADTDAKEDERIYTAWKTGHYRTYAELAAELRLNKRDVGLAIDRHEKRQKRGTK